MNKIFWLLSVGLSLVACNDNKSTDSPKNTDLIIQNLKGMVQRTEETSYKVDSTGKIGAMDSCCASIQEFDEKGYNPKYFSKRILFPFAINTLPYKSYLEFNVWI